MIFMSDCFIVDKVQGMGRSIIIYILQLSSISYHLLIFPFGLFELLLPAFWEEQLKNFRLTR